MSLFTDLRAVLTPYANRIKGLKADLGDLSDLETTNKSSIVVAINEAAQSGGSEVVIDDTLTQTGQAADAKAVGDALSAVNDEINALQVDELGTTVITASDFTNKTGGITYSYDPTEQSVTLTKTTTTKQDWQSLSTPVDFLVGKITEGKTYRVHYRADILSGTPVIRMDVRRSNNSTVERLLLEDGTDGYLDFVATSDMSLVSVFITASTATGACEVKYSDIYLCEVKGKTVIDRTARTEIADIRSHLSDANVYKTIILRVLSSMSYNASGASSKMYKELFSMFFKLKESASITALPTDFINGGKGGACTDGKYIYQCCAFDNPSRKNLVKLEIETGEIVSTVEFANSNLPFGHANDMTYDPVTGYLYLATMLSDGSVIRFDSEDLSYVDTIYLLKGTGEPGKVWQIAFNRVTRQLIVTAVDEYRLYDPDGQYISTHQLATKINATEQGMETDGVYLYRITYAPSCIDVCDMDGTRIKTYDFTVPGEPETMMYDWAGSYYLTTTNTSNGLFYTADFMESK